MKNTKTHRHCAKCHYCNVVMDGKVQHMQSHTVNCEKVGHEDIAQLCCHLRSLSELPQDNKEDFLNGGTTGLCPHVQLSHNSLYASAHVAPFHPSLHCSNNTLHGGSVL